ncbi:MAG: XTP/dITP diphosphatase [Candidatus Bathyarchaeota archaeon]|nr:XTP/dITP diphosphatase [Candidatus Bathyarchaeota archaeon]MCZ2845197.1 XTP/dITP diphosphatase [Candidatus Bathyarchaeota archaeon]
MQKKVFFITSNPNKARECKNILSFFSIYVEIIKLQISEIQSDTLEEIARFSSLEAVRICKKPVLVEDSGLFINILNGFPGPYSSYIQNKIGNYGILKLMKGIKNRRAIFKSVIGFCSPKKLNQVFVGEVHGSISYEERGKEWAFDPIFIPDFSDKTYAQMSAEKKNEISHRRRALEKFAIWFNKEQNG